MWKFRVIFWLRILVVTILAIYLSIILFSAASMALAVTVPLKLPMCCQSPHDFGADYENVTIGTADGLALSGWYILSRNGAVIILLHSYYMDRRQVMSVAAMLVRHGYGILMYDQRASGESQGETRSLGWLDIPDVKQATAYLQTRPDVKNGQIGVYGCSMGGAIGIAATAGDPSIAAVAADAPSPLTFNEARPAVGSPDWAVNLPIYTLYYGFVSLRARTLPPTTTSEAIAQIAPRSILFISTGEGGERDRVNTYYTLAGEPKQHWNIPDASHCGGPYVRPDEYEQRLTIFFDTTLLNK